MSVCSIRDGTICRPDGSRSGRVSCSVPRSPPVRSVSMKPAPIGIVWIVFRSRRLRNTSSRLPGSPLRCEWSMSKLSVYVIAYNDEPNMRACLESVVGWADELVVVDSHSTDRTAAIAREFTDRVYQVVFKGFGDLRNQALSYTTHDWVFSLDSDERMTPELREEIRQVFARGPEADAYFVPRKNFFLGRWIE